MRFRYLVRVASPKMDNEVDNEKVEIFSSHKTMYYVSIKKQIAKGTSRKIEFQEKLVRLY